MHNTCMHTLMTEASSSFIVILCGESFFTCQSKNKTISSVQISMSVSWGYMTANSSALTLRVPSSVAALKGFKLIQMGPAQVRSSTMYAVLLGVSHTKQLMINTCTAYWMHRFCVLTISSYIPPWEVVVLHIGVGHSLTPMCKTTTPQGGI